MLKQPEETFKKSIKLCFYENCNTISSYNNIGETQGFFCKKHKTAEMVDVKNKLCEFVCCYKHPVYNFENEKYGIFCKEHKKTDMVNVISKCCGFVGCNKRPNYNFENKKPAIFCINHKIDNMVDVEHKRCCFTGCNKYPNYNLETEKSGVFCKEHKQINMINISKKQCKFVGCDNQPSYNFENEKSPIFCREHKQINMIYILSKRCEFIECNKPAYYNVVGNKIPVYCSQHKLDKMVNIKSKTCLYEWCDTQIHDKKYNGYCLRCYIHTFPDKPVSRNYKTKEYSVVEFIKNKFTDYTWISDKTVFNGCSKRRPDLLLDLGDNVIIIEVDENQHTIYDCSCENKRTMELSRDLGHRPIVFIRFNPDDYKIENKNITSCWGIDGHGICVVKKSKKKEWSERLNSLKNCVEYWINNKTDKTVEIIQLYYDITL